MNHLHALSMNITEMTVLYLGMPVYCCYPIKLCLTFEMNISAYIFEPLFPPLDWSDRQYYTRLPAKSWSKNQKLS